MTCEEAASLIPLQLDGELDALQSKELDAHLAQCEKCAAIKEDHQGLSKAIRTPFGYQSTPDDLRRRIEASTVGNAKSASRFFLYRAPVSFAAGLAAGIAICFVVLQGPSKRDAFASELIDSHVRSLMSSDLVDVKSSDQHTVKPWFQGKLDFSPGVVDLAKDGFPLIGGRLESLEGHPSAAIVYRHKKHVISLFATDYPALNLQTLDRKGFHVKHFQLDGIDYWAVSDVNAADLDVFVRDFRQSVTSSPL